MQRPRVIPNTHTEGCCELPPKASDTPQSGLLQWKQSFQPAAPRDSPGLEATNPHGPAVPRLTLSALLTELQAEGEKMPPLNSST